MAWRVCGAGWREGLGSGCTGGRWLKSSLSELVVFAPAAWDCLSWFPSSPLFVVLVVLLKRSISGLVFVRVG